jgi:hypothetical protein
MKTTLHYQFSRAFWERYEHQEPVMRILIRGRIRNIYQDPDPEKIIPDLDPSSSGFEIKVDNLSKKCSIKKYK